MGLLSQVYEFPSGAPPFEAIRQKMCEIEGRDIVAEISVVVAPSFPPLSREQQAAVDKYLAKFRKPGNAKKATQTSKGILFAAERMYFLDARKTHLNVNRSIDGTKVVMMGNNLELFKTACKALERLGGNEYRRGNQANNGSK